MEWQGWKWLAAWFLLVGATLSHCCVHVIISHFALLTKATERFAYIQNVVRLCQSHYYGDAL